MEQPYSLALIQLLKGVVYDYQKEPWANVLTHEADIKNYYAPLGLELYLDKSEGYAFLRQISSFETGDDVEDEVDPESKAAFEKLPKLTERRQLDFYSSLLCVMLRKYLLEQDAQGGSTRTIITRQEMIQRVKTFLPTTLDEAKQQEKIDSTINKVVKIGFLHPMDTENFEVHRIIKGFINATTIDEYLLRLQAYAGEKD